MLDYVDMMFIAAVVVGPRLSSHILVFGGLVFYTVLELCARPSFQSSS